MFPLYRKPPYNDFSEFLPESSQWAQNSTRLFEFQIPSPSSLQADADGPLRVSLSQLQHPFDCF